MTFSGVDYNTGLEIVDELRRIVPSGISMSQFVPRWILMFDCGHLRYPRRQTGRTGCGKLLCEIPLLTDEQMAALSCKSDSTPYSIDLGA